MPPRRRLVFTSFARGPADGVDLVGWGHPLSGRRASSAYLMETGIWVGRVLIPRLSEHGAGCDSSRTPPQMR